MTKSSQRYRTFRDFYPFYLSEHANRTSRILHFIGTGLVIAISLGAIITTSWQLLWLVPVLGYGFAWIGHFFFEKNKPATFQYPFFSLLGDFAMFRDLLTGRIRF